MLMVQEQKLLWAVEPKNYTGAAATKKWASLKLYGHLTIVIQTGAWAGGTAAVTVEQATAVAGTGAKALSIAKVWHDEATSGTLVEEVVASNTFNLDTANKIYVIEIDASELDVANGFDCVSVAIASPGANADFYGVIYVLSEAAYQSATLPSALVD